MDENTGTPEPIPFHVPGAARTVYIPAPGNADHTARAWLGVVALVAMFAGVAAVVVLLKQNGVELPRLTVVVTRPIPASPMGL